MKKYSGCECRPPCCWPIPRHPLSAKLCSQMQSLSSLMFPPGILRFAFEEEEYFRRQRAIQVCASDNQEEVTSPCECVVSMLEQFTELYEIGTAPRFMLSLIEDCLTEILTKSRYAFLFQRICIERNLCHSDHWWNWSPSLVPPRPPRSCQTESARL